MPLRERGARTDECVEIMIKLWRGAPVSHKGRFYRFENICMLPPPLQQPHPPLWAGGVSDQMLRRTARWCDGFFPVDVSPTEYRAAIDRIAAHAEEIDRDVSHLTRALHLFFRIGEHGPRERAEAERFLNRRRSFDVALPGDGRFAFGDPGDMLRTIEAFASIGVTHFVLNPLVTPDEAEGQVERVAEEILPRF